ncbi:hypothetical protein [Bacillus sp. AK031]
MLTKNKVRKLLLAIIVGVVSISAIFYFSRLPVGVADWFVPFKVVEPYVGPVEMKNEYSKVVSWNKVKLVYETEDGTFTVWATTDIGWNNVGAWGEEVDLLGGTGRYTGHYNEEEGVQMISFRLDKVEYAIDFKGSSLIPKEDLIEIANTIMVSKFALADLQEGWR